MLPSTHPFGGWQGWGARNEDVVREAVPSGHRGQEAGRPCTAAPCQQRTRSLDVPVEKICKLAGASGRSSAVLLPTMPCLRVRTMLSLHVSSILVLVVLRSFSPRSLLSLARRPKTPLCKWTRRAGLDKTPPCGPPSLCAAALLALADYLAARAEAAAASD